MSTTMQCSNPNCTKTSSDSESNALKLVCSSCRSASYCDKECQVADWKRHKKSCKSSSPKVPKQNAHPLPEGLSLRVDVATKEEDEYELITTVEISILNASKEKIGNLRIFIVPKEVGQSGEYFDIMDALDRDLSTFAYRCTTDNGFLHEDMCSHLGTRRWERADSRQIAYLDEIFVEESLRGRGIGTWAITTLLRKYERKINMIVARVALLTRCEPTLRAKAPKPTEREVAEFEARRDRVANFFGKVGFRRLGNTEFLGYHKNPIHPSRRLAAADDPPYQDVPPPRTDQEQYRYLLMNNGMPFSGLQI